MAIGWNGTKQDILFSLVTSLLDWIKCATLLTFHPICYIFMYKAKNELRIRHDFKWEMLNKNILVAIESGEASHLSWCPFQSVMTPPEPSITGINARKSYGCEVQSSPKEDIQIMSK